MPSRSCKIRPLSVGADMTAGESDTAAHPSDRGPRFPVVDWGYDRQLVDFRVAGLVQQLAAQRRRGDQAEQALSQLQLNLHTGREGPDGAVEVDPAQVLQR